MPIITGGQVMPGLRGTSAGVPGAGTDAVQTITFADITSGTFRLNFGGFWTAPITWSSTNNTLRDNVDAALEALPNIGTAGVATAVGSMVSGIGTLTVTFDGVNVAKRVQPDITVDGAGLVGEGAEATVETTTPGVNATGFGMLPGAIIHDIANGKAYVNVGTAAAPSWTVVGSAT